MTREEAVRYFKRHIDLYCVEGICREAEEMAIKALEQEPCDDAISRQAAIVQLSHNKIGDDDCDAIIQKDIETIKVLPPVAPQPKMEATR